MSDRIIEFRDALREAMCQEMRRDKRIFLIGGSENNSADRSLVHHRATGGGGAAYPLLSVGLELSGFSRFT